MGLKGKAGFHGVSADTPKNIMFGAGTIHKNLKYTESWNLDESIIGATSGGSKFSIIPEIYHPELDGAVSNIKGLALKVGEKASMEINLVELNKEMLTAMTLGQSGESADSNYDVIESKDSIVAGDYWDNIAYVGRTLKGENIIVIMDNALCTSGLDNEGKNKESSVDKVVFECHADPATGVEKLPWHIYHPKAI